ncbi:MAG: hypothetical protein INR62_11130 [Rhodospirillales bacterium]|nr:hypothetical protein [Acetobacter sp.]
MLAQRFIIALTLSALAVPAVADTPEQKMFRTARAVVRLHLLTTFCSPFYLVDKVKVDSLAVAMLKDGINRFGQAQMKQALDAIDQEFAPIITRDGAATWCPAQRLTYRKLGLPDLIGGPLR